jgi:DNA repair protein RadC
MSVFYQDLLERANYVLQDQLLELKNADYTDLPVLECLAHNVASQIQFIREIESDILNQEAHNVNS